MADFDIESLNDNLDAFGLSCPDDDHYVSKLTQICKTYHKDEDCIVDELIVLLKNSSRMIVNMQILEQLEEKFDQAVQNSAATPKSVKRPARAPLTDQTAFYKTTFTNETEMEVDAKELANISLDGKYMDFKPFPPSPVNSAFFKRPDAGSVTSTQRGSKFVDIDKGIAQTKIGNVIVTSKKPQKRYGGDKTSLAIEAKSRRFNEMGNILREAYPEITEWATPNEPSADTVYRFGQLILDDSKEGEKFGENAAALMIDDEQGSIVNLDFSKLADCVTIFPGQIVALRGENQTGELFVVDQILTPPPPKLASFEKDCAAEIWFASGPFTSSDNCGYEQLCELLDNVRDKRPNVLVLTGPFVDRKNSFLDQPAFTITYDILLEDLMIKIEEKLENVPIKVILQPHASREYGVVPVFPCPELSFLSKRTFNQKFVFVPEPCTVKFSEMSLEMAMTSSEIITHLSKTEYHRSPEQENSDRIARLSSHLLSQRSMYPLEPTAIPSSLEDVIEVCKIVNAPHIIVTPSVLGPYVKKVNNTVFINPSTLGKGSTGTYVKATINMRSSDAASADSIAEFSNFEICKI